MKKIRIYSDEEIKILMNNPNVTSIKNKSQIQYSDNFKLWAVQEKLKYPEKTARQIFESGGFDMRILDERTPQRRICSWVKKYKMFGIDYFINKNYTYCSLSKNKIEKSIYILKIQDGQLTIYRGDESNVKSNNN